MGWKKVTPTYAGSTQLFGGDDINKISDMFSGVSGVDTVDINNVWVFRSGMLQYRNPANTFDVQIQVAAIAADRILTIPLMTVDGNIVVDSYGNQFTNQQTILMNIQDQLIIYRPVNTVGSTSRTGIRFDHQNSTPVRFTGSGYILFSIVDNTAGAFDSAFEIWTAVNNAAVQRLVITDAGITVFPSITVPLVITNTIVQNNNTGYYIKSSGGTNIVAAYMSAGNLLSFGDVGSNGINTALWSGAATPAFQFGASNTVTISPTWTVPIVLNNNVNILMKDIGGTGRQVAKISTGNRLIIGDSQGIVELQLLTGGTLGNLLFDANTKFTHTVAAQAGVAEVLAKFTMSDDTGSYVQLQNATSTDGAFAPWLITTTSANVSTTHPSLYIYNYIPAASDTGGVPVLIIDGRRLGDAALTTRPVVDIRNAGTSIFKINVKGDVIQTIIAQAGVGEVLHRWGVSDVAGGYIRFLNISATDALFVPKVEFYNAGAGSGQPACVYTHLATPADDTGATTGVAKFDSRRDDNTAITGRALFDFLNANVSVFRINAYGDITQSTKAQTGVAEACQTWTIGDDTSSTVRISNGFTTDGIFAPVLMFQTSANVDAGKSACYFYTYINVASDTTGSVPACAFNAGNSNATAIANRPLYAWRNNSVDVARMNANGDMWNTIKAQTSIAETIHKWSMADNATAYFLIQNAVGTDAMFVPKFQSYNFGATSANMGFYFVNYINGSEDTGSVPIFVHDIRRAQEALVTVRPGFEWRDWGTALMTLSLISLDLHNLEIRNVIGTNTMTEIEGWQTNKRTGHINGGGSTANTFGTGICSEGTFYGSISPTRNMYGNGGITTQWLNVINSTGPVGWKCAVYVRSDRAVKLSVRGKTSRIANSRYFVVLKTNSGQIAGGTTVPIANAESGIAIGYTEADTTYHVWSNDGTGAASDVDTNITIPAWANDAEYLDLEVDTAGTTWTWTIRSAAGAVLGTGVINVAGGQKIPVAANTLHMHIHADITDTTGTEVNIFSGDLECKK